MESFSIPTELLLHVPATFLIEKVLKKQAMDEQQVLLVTSAVSAALTMLYQMEKTSVKTISGNTILYSVIWGIISAGGGHYFSDLLPELLS